MEHDNNRSSAFTPDQLATINTFTANAVKEAITAVFTQLAPVFEGMQLTPEKIQAMKSPYVDPKKLARELRESQQTREQEAENQERLRRMKASCPHRDVKGMEAICLVHNFPDRQARGVCPICQDLIEPRHWEIESPDPNSGKSRPVLKNAHKDYDRVLALESRS